MGEFTNFTNKVIVFDNIIFSLQRAGGISVVWQNIIDGAIKDKTLKRLFLEYPNSNIFRKKVEIPSDEIILQSLGLLKHKRYINPTCNLLNDNFIFHSSYYRTCSNPYAKNITTVHDFTYDYFYKGLRKKIHCSQRNSAIMNSDAIVCISNNTKKDLVRFLPEIDQNKIFIINNGVSDEYFQIQKKYSDYSDYIMFVGARIGYKNFKFAVEVVSQTPFKLMICGNELTQDEHYLLDKYLGNQRYKVVIRPSNKELNEFYNSVFCLLYPSSYEGFGIPVLEAQRAGCPVIALNASSIPDIIGNKKLLMNELTISEFNNKISILNSNHNRLEFIEEGIKNANKYSWHKMSQEYLDLYHSILP